MSGWMVKDDLRELTNILNRRISWLDRWEIWLSVLEKYSCEQEKWMLRIEFVEPVACWCMLRPSAIRELLIRVATNAVHQANLSLDPSERDELDEDRNPHLRRFGKEAQLSRITTRWPNAQLLCSAIKKIDGNEYRIKTRDYRNRASHGIAPHFEFGEVNAVTRSIKDAEKLVAQPMAAIDSKKFQAKKL